MKIIKIEVYIFLIFLTIINLIAITVSVENLKEDGGFNYQKTMKTLSIVTLAAAALQIFSSIIFIIIPRKGSRVLFFPQLLITIAFFIASTGYFLELAGNTPLERGPFEAFWIIFISVEGLNGLATIYMLLILGREAWGDMLSEDRPSKDMNYLQSQNSLPRFQPPPQHHPQQQYGYGGNKPY